MDGLTAGPAAPFVIASIITQPGTKPATDRVVAVTRNQSSSAQLQLLAPVQDGFALLGEPAKIASVSKQRFVSVVIDSSR